MDLSFPHGKSVNDGIDADMASLSYIKVEEVATRAAQMGWGSLLAKFDIEEAYRIVPVHPDDKSSLLSGTTSCISMQLSPLGFAVPHSYSQLWLIHYNEQFNSEEYLI